MFHKPLVILVHFFDPKFPKLGMELNLLSHFFGGLKIHNSKPFCFELLAGRGRVGSATSRRTVPSSAPMWKSSARDPIKVRQRRSIHWSPQSGGIDLSSTVLPWLVSAYFTIFWIHLYSFPFNHLHPLSHDLSSNLQSEASAGFHISARLCVSTNTSGRKFGKPVIPGNCGSSLRMLVSEITRITWYQGVGTHHWIPKNCLGVISKLDVISPDEW